MEDRIDDAEDRDLAVVREGFDGELNAVEDLFHEKGRGVGEVGGVAGLQAMVQAEVIARVVGDGRAREEGIELRLVGDDGGVRGESAAHGFEEARERGL